MKKILIIEDDKGISASLKLYLENSNHKIELHDEGSQAVKKISLINPDLIILDINLPGKDGIEITKEVRKNSQVPIVMLTARGSELDRIKGLEIGADDYVAKPFSPRELLARINTILRRTTDSEENLNIISYNGVVLNLDKKIAEVNGNDIGLTTSEFEILRKIFEAKGGIVTRDTIMKEIIGYDKYVYDRTIDTHIKNIRRKIGNKDIILTVRGEGYRINK
ncbi:response regulator transcription factor [Candidatus Gracilibacteria bacterium]|nr:response regulator transcription factor [Candidatus Gracilibacteria bacterium]